MMSRILARNVWQQARPCVFVRTISTTGTSHQFKGTTGTPIAEDIDIFENEKNPQRDHKNFPRRKRPMNHPAVRHGFIPETWFDFFHSKTGVTGPYMFLASFGTYLISKEIWVLEHEFYCGITLFGVLGFINHKFGDQIDAYLTKGVDDEDASLRNIRQKEIDRCKDAIADEEKAQWMGTSYEQLIEAKKENVALQLEAEYRGRLQEAYTQVKKRLDYQLQTANVIRAHEQRHMVSWIVDNVKKSITAKQEEDALKKCISDLKALA